jgi:hypothetical protein
MKSKHSGLHNFQQLTNHSYFQDKGSISYNRHYARSSLCKSAESTASWFSMATRSTTFSTGGSVDSRFSVPTKILF